MINIINKYIIKGNIVEIFLQHRDKTKSITIIDLEDLPKLLDFKYSWSPRLNHTNNRHYAHTTMHLKEYQEKYKRKGMTLQSFILETEVNVHIDHINHDTLDNRKENLRIISRPNNAQNRSGKNSNNKSGYRNVCYNKAFKKTPWQVQLQLNGKNTVLKRFYDVDEAGRVAEEMRQKYYGEYAGLS